MPFTLETAKAEYDYIVSIDYRNPGKDFNNDTACFARYVDMQARIFEHEGFLAIAKDLRIFLKSI